MSRIDWRRAQSRSGITIADEREYMERYKAAKWIAKQEWQWGI
jgi:hypothetical protein